MKKIDGREIERAKMPPANGEKRETYLTNKVTRMTLW